MTMVSTLTPAEEAQLGQTIEMFEVITQSQPNDYQSLEILKEAYSKLGREADAIGTSKRIAQAYVEMGQLSSAILEYETVLQRCPEDPDVQAALKKIEAKANSFSAEEESNEPAAQRIISGNGAPKNGASSAPPEVDDGRRMMHKLFVESKLVPPQIFQECWQMAAPDQRPGQVSEPFLQILAERNVIPVEKSLSVICDHMRIAYVPLLTYDLDVELARKFSAEVCRRWCVLPFDRMSKTVFLATANPFNQQAAKELAEQTSDRLLWYLAPPADLVKNVRRLFR